jgi:hypothetical protein
MVSVLEEADGDVLDDEWKLQKIEVEAIAVAVAEKQSTSMLIYEKKDWLMRHTYGQHLWKTLNDL